MMTGTPRRLPRRRPGQRCVSSRSRGRVSSQCRACIGVGAAGWVAEAARRPTMRFVTLKSEDQLDMQTLHRVRDRIVAERTSLMNQLRAILLERGIIVPKGRAKLRLRISELILQPCEELSPRIRLLIEDMLRRW